MARMHKFVGAPTGDAGVNNAEVSKQEFGRRIQARLIELEWNQSDLARAAFGTTVNSKGQTVAKNREMISQFVGGQSLPSPLTLHKIAAALRMKPEELLPQIKHKAVESDVDPEIDFKVGAGKSGEGLLRINRIVTLDQFARIIAILKEPRKEDAPKAPNARK